MADEQSEPVSIGELIDDGKVKAVKAIAVGLGVFFLGAGLVYTGLHNYNLFRRIMPADQEVFAWIPVVLLEGSIAAFMIGSFVWFGFGLQKTLATVFGWLLFVLAAANTLIDSLFASHSASPDWLAGYATFVVPVLPVVIVAMWKIVIDCDPSKRERDYKMALAGAVSEAKYRARIRALRAGGLNARALQDYGTAFDAALAAMIRESAPVIDGEAHEVKRGPAESWLDALKRAIAGLGGGGTPETVQMANDDNGASVVPDDAESDKKTESKKDKEGPKPSTNRTTK